MCRIARVPFFLTNQAAFMTILALLAAIVCTEAQAERVIFQIPTDLTQMDEGAEFGSSVVFADLGDGSGPSLFIGAPYAYLADSGWYGEEYIVPGPFGQSGVFVPSPLVAPEVFGANSLRLLGFAATVATNHSYVGGGFLPTLVVGAPFGTGLAYSLSFNGTDIEMQELGTSHVTLPAYGRYGHSVTAVDFNGDGYSDLVVGSNEGSGEGIVCIYLGGQGADDEIDLAFVRGASVYGFGSVVVGVGDVSGDGRGDLIIGTAGGGVHLLFGRDMGQASGTAPVLSLALNPVDYDGVLVSAERCYAAAGGIDLTGDELSEIVVTTSASGSDRFVRVYSGPFSQSSVFSPVAEIHGGTSFGDRLAIGGDVDGDGAGDLLVGAPGWGYWNSQSNVGSIAAFFGGRLPTFLDASTGGRAITRDSWFVSPAATPANAYYGSAVGFIGDQDGDGRDDIFVGSKGNHAVPVVAGSVFGYSLAASDKITVVNTTTPFPAYGVDGATTFSVAASHVDGLQLQITMDSGALGITGLQLDDNYDGTYSGVVPGLDILPGIYDVEIFAVSPWDLPTGGDGAFTLVRSTVEALDATVAYSVPANVVAQTGLNYAGTPYSSVVWDYDGDHDKDLFISISDDYSQLYTYVEMRPTGVPSFTVLSPLIFVGGSPQAGLRGLAVGDLDYSDGHTDLFAAHATDSRLYYWNGSQCVNVAPAVGVDQHYGAIAGTWADATGDGNLDLFVCRAEAYVEDPPHYGAAKVTPASILLTNSDAGGGQRALVPTPSAGLPQNLYSTNATWADFDQDGDPDLFVGALYEAGAGFSKLFTNNGGIMTDETATLLGSMPLASVVACSWNDFDNDSVLDLISARHDGSFAVYFGTSGGGFDDGIGGEPPFEFGPAYGVSGMLVYDYNSDGFVDVLGLSNDDSRGPRLYLNQSTDVPMFVEMAGAMGAGAPGKVHGGIAADFGGPGGEFDGIADLFLGRATATGAFYFAGGPAGGSAPDYHYAGIRLVGAPNVVNAAGIGATVVLHAGDAQLLQVVDGGSLRGSQRYSELLFGLGEYSGAITVDVIWPNGFVVNGIAVAVDGTTDVPYAAVIDDATVTSSYEIIPFSSQVKWKFEWYSSGPVDPALTSVHFDLSGVLWQCDPGQSSITPTDTGVSQTITSLPDGRVRIEVEWANIECVPRCNIPYWVESGPTGLVDASEVKTHSVPLCAQF